jgi:hypothetical protein
MNGGPSLIPWQLFEVVSFVFAADCAEKATDRTFSLGDQLDALTKRREALASVELAILPRNFVPNSVGEGRLSLWCKFATLSMQRPARCLRHCRARASPNGLFCYFTRELTNERPKSCGLSGRRSLGRSLISMAFYPETTASSLSR